jgi:hypothetical protein
MDELAGSSAAERASVESALSSLDAALERRPRTAVELAAVATFLIIVYAGIEGVIKRVRLSQGIQSSSSDLWRKDPLERAASEGLISVPLRDELYPYLEHRDSFVLAPATVLDEGRLVGLASGARAVWSRFLAEAERGGGANPLAGGPAPVPGAVSGRAGPSARRGRG